VADQAEQRTIEERVDALEAAVESVAAQIAELRQVLTAMATVALTAQPAERPTKEE